MGDQHLLVMEGELWKHWRSLFNPGFSASNMLTHVPTIVRETQQFCANLRERAARGEVFQMEQLTTDLTVQVIGHVVLGDSMSAQAQGADFTALLRNQLDLMSQISRSQGLRKWARRQNPFHRRKIRRNQATMAKIQDPDDQTKSRTKYVIDLALDAMPSPVDGKMSSLDPSHLEALSSQTRLFLFAGHDTTSTTLCHDLYTLSQYPRWCDQLRADHAAILGPDPGDPAAAALAACPHLLNEMPVTTAVVKEVLRLYPPARTVLVDPETGQEFPTAGCMLSMVHFGPHRDPRYFPDPHSFRPERWLKRPNSGENSGEKDSDGNDPLPSTERSHPHAWRPFEVGPRACIGQDLALVMRQFDVTSCYELEKGSEEKALMDKYKWIGAPAYAKYGFTSKVLGGLPVKVVERQ
ncbi:cytochrome P450 [Phyllosticta citrichinensis]|uniref:Cytochrome P450 n=1 Tax=Phyllosticta citrichinensis TaxID=1130410 RepID=A0ABR1XL51_9PEZI